LQGWQKSDDGLCSSNLPCLYSNLYHYDSQMVGNDDYSEQEEDFPDCCGYSSLGISLQKVEGLDD